MRPRSAPSERIRRPSRTAHKKQLDDRVTPQERRCLLDPAVIREQDVGVEPDDVVALVGKLIEADVEESLAMSLQ